MRKLMRINMLLVFAAFTAFAMVAQAQPEAQQPNSYDMSRESLEQAFASLNILESAGVVVAYNGTTTTIINKKRAALDKSHPLYVSEDFEADDTLLMQTRLSETDRQTFYLLFSEGPSADPGFYFIKTSDPGRMWAELPGTALAIPGSGAVYVANRYNTTFTSRTKHLYMTTALVEVPQPYYYVGLKTHTLMPVTLHASADEKQSVAQLPKGSEIEVLLADTRFSRHSKTCFLIKTPFGLLGWSCLPDEQYRSTIVEGVGFWGD